MANLNDDSEEWALCQQVNSLFYRKFDKPWKCIACGYCSSGSPATYQSTFICDAVVCDHYFNDFHKLGDTLCLKCEESIILKIVRSDQPCFSKHPAFLRPKESLSQANMG